MRSVPCSPGLSANGLGFAASMMTQIDAGTVQAHLRARLASDHTPVLVITGPCNYIKWAVTYQYKSTFPNSTLVVVPGAGHDVYFDRPALYLQCVRAFLRGGPLPLRPYAAGAPPARA